MRRRAGLAVFAIVAFLIEAGSSASTSDVDGRIVFASNATGNYDVYTMMSDGTDLVNVTNDPATDLSPAWSPDRTRIAFSSRRGGNRDIYVINADGSGLLRITTDPGTDDFPAWSPDGTRIAYSNLRAGPILNIYTAASNGTGDVQQLTNDPRFLNTAPTYSPDGEKIAFARAVVLGPPAIWVMHADGTHPKQLTPSELNAHFPDWSPDGSRIVFINNACPTCDVSDIFTINPSGNHLRQLTHDMGNNIQPNWSGDGSKIVFANTSDFDTFNQDIWTMNADGSDPVNLTNSPTVDDLAPDE